MLMNNNFKMELARGEKMVKSDLLITREFQLKFQLTVSST